VHQGVLLISRSIIESTTIRPPRHAFEVRVALDAGPLEPIDDGVALLLDLALAHVALLDEPHLSDLVARSLLEIAPRRIHDADVVLLAADDAVLLHQLHAVYQHILGDVVDRLAFREPQVDVSATKVVDMEPACTPKTHVYAVLSTMRSIYMHEDARSLVESSVPDIGRQSILDEILVLILVLPHVDDILGVDARKEEHHGVIRSSQASSLNSRQKNDAARVVWC